MFFFFLSSALYFFAASAFNVWHALQSIGPFVNRGTLGGANGNSTGVSEFINEFNLYLAGVNKTNMRINLVSAGVNLFAGIGAVAAACSL